jgi:hypothetical protein
MNNLCVHITFAFEEKRLDNLYKIINNIKNYSFFSKKDVFIHTNKKFDIQDSNLIIHDIDKLDHPWLLTWCHRPFIKNQIEEYDVFMYLEDDIFYPENAIKYWFENNKKLQNTKYDLGFCLLEKDDKNNEYFVSLRKNEKCTNKIILDNVEYIELKRNYKASWIYDKKYLKNTNNNFFIPLNKFNKNCRVLAARGNQNEDKNTLVPLYDNFYNLNSKIYHLSNKYYKSNNKLGYGSVNFKNSIKIH